MKLGISTASLDGKLNTEDALRWIGDQGAQCAEVFLATFCEYDRAFAKELVRAKRATGISISSMHTLNTQYEGQLFSRHERQKRDAMNIFCSVLDIGAELGAKNYVLHGPAQIRYVNHNTYYQNFAAVTQELSRACRERGMRLTWENVHWTHYNHPDFISRLSEAAGEPLYTTLDIKQAMQSGTDAFTYLEAMGERLVNVHVCDFDAEGVLYLPLKGEFDFRALFDRTRALPSVETAVIEVYDRSFSRLEELADSYKALLEFYESTGKDA